MRFSACSTRGCKKKWSSSPRHREKKKINHERRGKLARSLHIGWVCKGGFGFGNDPSAGSPTERIQEPESLNDALPLLHSANWAFPPRRLQQSSSFEGDRLNLRQQLFSKETSHHPLPYSLCAFCQLGQLGSGLSIVSISQIVTIRRGITSSAAPGRCCPT